MEVAVVVVSAVVAFLLVRRARRRRPPRGVMSWEPSRDIDPLDEYDLDERFAAIAADRLDEQGELIAAHVTPVVRRGVPVRRVEPVAGLRSSRLHFADGTSLLARGEVAGDVAVLAQALQRHRVAPASCVRAPDGVHVHFQWGVRRGVGVVVTGLDQPE